MKINNKPLSLLQHVKSYLFWGVFIVVACWLWNACQRRDCDCPNQKPSFGQTTDTTNSNGGSTGGSTGGGTGNTGGGNTGGGTGGNTGGGTDNTGGGTGGKNTGGGLASPLNGAINANISPNLNWRAAIDPDGDLVYYNIYLDTLATAAKILDSNLTANWYAVSNLKPLQKYYWKVVAFDKHKNSDTTPIWHFTTMKTP